MALGFGKGKSRQSSKKQRRPAVGLDVEVSSATSNAKYIHLRHYRTRNTFI